MSTLYKTVWSDKAVKTANTILKHLREEWTEKEVNKFLDEIDRIVSAIEFNPRLFRISKKKNNVHLALVNKQTFMVYQVRPNKRQIVLLLFWGTKQNPSKLNY